MLLDSANQIALFIGLVLAFVLPCVRSFCRWQKGIKPIYQTEILRHDLMNSFSLPFFVLILISPIFDSIKVDESALAGTALYAIILVIMDTFDNGRSPCLRTRDSDYIQQAKNKTDLQNQI